MAQQTKDDEGWPRYNTENGGILFAIFVQTLGAIGTRLNTICRTLQATPRTTLDGIFPLYTLHFSKLSQNTNSKGVGKNRAMFFD